MSLSVVPAHWLQVGVVAAEGDEGFEAPSTADFWWPVIGSDTSNFTITRPMLVMTISVAVLAWFFITVAGPIRPGSASLVLVAIVLAIVNTVVAAYLASLIARLYAQLAGKDEG